MKVAILHASDEQAYFAAINNLWQLVALLDPGDCGTRQLRHSARGKMSSSNSRAAAMCIADGSTAAADQVTM